MTDWKNISIKEVEMYEQMVDGHILVTLRKRRDVTWWGYTVEDLWDPEEKDFQYDKAVSWEMAESAAMRIVAVVRMRYQQIKF